jgi:FkbM family methyltransferase
MIKKNILSLRDKLTGNSHIRAKLHNLELSLNESYSITEAIRSEIQQLSSYASGGLITIGEKELIVKIFNDLIMYLDPRDMAVVPHLALERIWEKETTLAWNYLIDKFKPSTVFDIGANFGYFGLLAAQRLKFKKTNQVIMFEANPNLISYINKTLSVNWLKEITHLENLAVSNTEGQVTLNILQNYIGSSSLHSQHKLDSYLGHKMGIQVAESMRISSITIDKYCKDHAIKSIDLLKMDIEGFEDKAYEGMRRVINNSPKLIIFIEFTSASYDNPKAFYKLIKDDFKYIYTIQNDGDLIDKSDQEYSSVVNEEDLAMLVLAKTDLIQK